MERSGGGGHKKMIHVPSLLIFFMRSLRDLWSIRPVSPEAEDRSPPGKARWHSQALVPFSCQYVKSVITSVIHLINIIPS